MNFKNHNLTTVARRTSFFVLCVFIGIVVGLATLGLIELISLVQILFFADFSEKQYTNIVEESPVWLVLIMPAVGGLFVGILIQFLEDRRYHGVADVMEACAVRGARMDSRSGVGAAVAASVSIGSGIPVGREGPAVHIGASISAWLAEKLCLSPSDSLVLLGCGAAAAVTTSFNSPIAGVLFALEVVVGYYTMRVFAPIVVASVGAVVIRQLITGLDTVFSLNPISQPTVWELPFFVLLGIVCALFVLLMIFLVGKIQDFWLKFELPLWLSPTIAGLVIGAFATQFPDSLGQGFSSIDELLNQPIVPTTLILLLFIRFLSTSIALGSGFAGGVFSPALVFGAMLGGIMWYFLSLILPLGFSSQETYVIVGMGALASAMLGAPISTVIIVFELTASYEATVGVMLAAAMASVVMQLSPYNSFFRWQLSRRGVNLSAGRDQSLLRTQTVKKLIKSNYSRIEKNASIITIEQRMSHDKTSVAVLLDEEGNLEGSLDIKLLVSASIKSGAHASVVDELCDADTSIIVHANLVVALQEMADRNLDYLPVVMPTENAKKFVGIIHRSDLLRSYYDVVRAARAEEFGVN